jgi:hypothetical protein
MTLRFMTHSIYDLAELVSSLKNHLHVLLPACHVSFLAVMHLKQFYSQLILTLSSILLFLLRYVYIMYVYLSKNGKKRNMIR